MEPREVLTRKWSASAYEDYNTCGEMFYLKRVKKVPTLPSLASCAGTAFHSWTDYYDDNLIKYGYSKAVPLDEQPSFAELLEYELAETEEEHDLDRSEFRTFGNWGLDAYLTNGAEWCVKYAAWRNEESDWEVAVDLPPDAKGNTRGIEYALEYQCGDVYIRGYVDRIWYVPAVGLVATDTKTWGEERPSTQLVGYQLGLQACGIPVVAVGYYEARKGVTPVLKEWKGWNMDRLAMLYEQSAWSEFDGFYIPHPSKHCFVCDVKAHCIYRLD